MDEKLRKLAEGLQFLYGESQDDAEGFSAPIYDELGELAQRYSQKTLIAQGGMKSIYRVFDQKTERFVAMAELHETAPTSSYEPFLREARLTAKLEHPNIISIHDIGLLENSRPYFTMDLKVGDSLRHILKELAAGNEEYIRAYTLNNLLEIFSTMHILEELFT
jgi:serine/threonine protein kinase